MHMQARSVLSISCMIALHHCATGAASVVPPNCTLLAPLPVVCCIAVCCLLLTLMAPCTSAPQTTLPAQVMASDGLQGASEFDNERLLLSRLHHAHLVRLLGVCISPAPPLRCLVYELMPGGNVEEQLQVGGANVCVREGVLCNMFTLHDPCDGASTHASSVVVVSCARLPTPEGLCQSCACCACAPAAAPTLRTLLLLLHGCPYQPPTTLCVHLCPVCVCPPQAGRRVLPWWLRLRVAAQVSAAITYLHTLPASAGGPLIHRDIKPANMFLDGRLNAKVGEQRVTGGRWELGARLVQAVVWGEGLAAVMLPVRSLHYVALFASAVVPVMLMQVCLPLLLLACPFHC